MKWMSCYRVFKNKSFFFKTTLKLKLFILIFRSEANLGSVEISEKTNISQRKLQMYF